MSNKAITAVWAADISPPTRKLVLLFMADSLNEVTGQLNPSIGAVARACGISVDQARRHIHDLIEHGLVEVVGNFYGGAPMATRNYRLKLESATPCMDATPGTDAADPLHPCSLPLAPMQPTPGTDASRTRRNQKEPEKKQNGERVKRAPALARPDSVAETVWNDFLANRKAKRAPLTATALKGIEAEAHKAGISLQDALAFCCLKGWQGFSADWYANARAGGPAKAQNGASKTGRHVGFDAMNYRDGINDDGTFH